MTEPDKDRMRDNVSKPLDRRARAKSRRLGVETETNFGISPTYPKGHFGTLHDILLDYHFLVFDIAFTRIPRASFKNALIRKGLKPIAHQDQVGRPATVDVCRDLIDEMDHQENYVTACRPTTIDQIIKMMITCELYGLNDIALDTAERFAERLGARLDVDRAIWLLASPDLRPNEQIPAMSKSVCMMSKSVRIKSKSARMNSRPVGE